MNRWMSMYMKLYSMYTRGKVVSEVRQYLSNVGYVFTKV